MDLDVSVLEVDGTQMAAKITGTFRLAGEEFPFTAIAFGRIGGQNIGAKLDAQTDARLRELRQDPADVCLELQRRLLQGEMRIPDDLKKESFADG